MAETDWDDVLEGVPESTGGTPPVSERVDADVDHEEPEPEAAPPSGRGAGDRPKAKKPKAKKKSGKPKSRAKELAKEEDVLLGELAEFMIGKQDELLDVRKKRVEEEVRLQRIADMKEHLRGELDGIALVGAADGAIRLGSGTSVLPAGSGTAPLSVDELYQRLKDGEKEEELLEDRRISKTNLDLAKERLERDTIDAAKSDDDGDRGKLRFQWPLSRK